ncbi:hypothetical protein [Zavarzinia sp.]|uniref:hypothetical protein n=1 Tax=Zavarzinia sp. TaxID=2027920 RepID=UPI003568671F
MRKIRTTFAALAVAAAASLSACVPPDLGAEAMPPPPPKPLDLDKVDSAIEKASGETPGTTIYSNVFNLSGGSCVDAATRRGQAIATSLNDMKAKGDIPADHTVKVYTYSGYRVPGIDYGSLHTYTVTQISDGKGKPVATWTSDNYLGPNSVSRKPGDGGYGNWNDPLTSEVRAPSLPRDRQGGGGGGGGGD